MADDTERLEVSFDDDDAGDPPGSAGAAPSPAGGDPDALVITLDDLDDVHNTPPAYPGFAPAAGMPGPLPAPVGKSAGGLADTLQSSLWQSAIAGLAGGFLGWMLTELFLNGDAERGGSLGATLVLLGLFGALIGACIGLGLGSVDALMTAVYEKALAGGAIGFGIGFGGGFIGGILAQLVFGALTEGPSNFLLVVFARIVGWAIVGGLVGLGPGIAARSGQKTVHGLIGGLIGGAIGGALFDVIGNMIPWRNGLASRAIAITVMGGCIGLAIAMVEELAKQAWLRISGGAMVGKEFILYHAVTNIGSSPKCEITLLKDPLIQPQHLAIQAIPGGYQLEALMGEVSVNGRPVSRVRLRDNDQILLGSTVLTYAERAAKQAMPLEAYR